MSLTIGDLIIDNRNREGIVIAKSDPPSASWLAQQNDHRVRTVGDCNWWLVLPSTGGAVCVPESLAKYLRPATVEDAYRYALQFPQSYYQLVKLFPNLAGRMAPPKLY